MADDLRKLPSLDRLNLAPGERALVGKALSDRDAYTLEVWWPECFTSVATGKVVMPADAAAQLEALFERFGVPLKVDDNSLEVLGRAYDVFGVSLAAQVVEVLRHPERNLKRYYSDWPQDWVDYIEAVANDDAPASRRLAMKVQPLAPECVYPPGVIVAQRRQQP